jgi:hypothetical protein
MVGVFRIILVCGVMTGGTITSGVRLVSPGSDAQGCDRIGDNDWNCNVEVCFYYNGAWVCIDE